MTVGAAEKPKGGPGVESPPPPSAGRFYVVLTGNPNCGKTTVFNALTGLRAKVGNYAGVTVERKEGRLPGTPAKLDIRILDLPGTYSLSPNSLDEQISRDVLMHRLPELPPPGLIVVVVDASNLQRNLYYATQVIELGHPTVLALNMVDVAENNGHHIDAEKLGEILGVPVLPVVASAGQGIPELKQKIISLAGAAAPLAPIGGELSPEFSRLEPPNQPRAERPLPPPARRGGGRGEGTTVHGKASAGIAQTAARPVGKPENLPTAKLFCQLPGLFRIEATGLAELLAATFKDRRLQATAEALLLLSNEKALASSKEHYPQKIQDAVAAARQRLESHGIDWRGAPIEWRYARVAEIQQAVTSELAPPGETFSDKLDRLLTHKIWGTIIFVALMAIMFQSIFTFAKIPMNALQAIVDWSGATVGKLIPPGDLNDLLVNGVIAGVGAVVVFLPQILLLFLFIGFLEDTGYMARAAFLMDRLMSKVGLHGKSFIPMLSSYACAIPGIMATRTIETPKDRLVTILVAPLMSCSARLPVYTLLIGACIPDIKIFWVLKLQGLTLLAMYLLGTVVALLMAWLFKKTLLKGETPMLIMELPPYKRPLLRVVARHMWDRARLFLRRAGTVILGVNIILWFLATYPKSGEARVTNDPPPATVQSSPATLEAAGAQLRNSFAGHMGRAIEPIIAPLGFDWKIGIGLISSFAAREVFVSTMSTVYNVGNPDESEQNSKVLQDTLRGQKRPDGSPLYTPLLAITLMVFYVFAMQCASTVAVVRRETNSWKWPVFQWLYMGVLAWGLAFLTWRIGHLFGWH